VKNKFFPLFLSCLLLSLNFAFSQGTEKPKVGLVLSGGGAKGFAHIGVLEVFEKEGIPIDYIVGTSIGSIIGGLHAIGYNSDQLKDFATNQEWIDLLSDHISREYKNIYERYDQDRYLVSFKLKTDEGISLPAGVVQGHNIMNLLCELTAKYHEEENFNNFPIPFTCVAADLVTGEEVVINNGYLPEAMFASMSIPTIFAPSEINDKLVVDGGIVNNFPTDIAKKMGADIIIGVDIQTQPLAKDEIGDITDVIGQMISYMGFEKYKENKNLCEVIIEPNIEGFSSASFSNSAADTLIKRGKEATILQLDKIKNLLSKNDIPLKRVERKYSFNDEFTMNNFMVEGIGENTIDYLLDKSDFNFPDTYNFKKINKGITRLYGSDSFKKAYFKLLNDNTKTFRLIIDEKNTNSMNAGFNFNSTDKAAILLNLTFRNELFKGTRFSFDAKLSTNTMLGASFQFSNESLPELDLSLLYKNFSIEIYDKNDKMSEADVKYINSELSAFQVIGSNYLMNIGVRGEYYKFNPFFSQNASTNISASKNTVIIWFGKVRFDNLDDKYYPKSGFDLNAEFSYATNTGEKVLENSTTPILSYNLKSSISLGSDVCFLPSFYGRLLLNENSDLFRNNVLGGTEVTKLLDYHIPFVGIRRVVFAKDKTIVARAEVRVRVSDDNFFSLIFNGATHFTKFEDWQTRELLGGYGLKYSYNSFIGPIDLLISTSDYTNKFDFFINVGRWF
jgi:NTE family protein